MREGSVADRVDAGDDAEDDGDEVQESDEDDQENEENEEDDEEDLEGESTDKEALQHETRPHGLGPFDSDGDTAPAPVRDASHPLRCIHSKGTFETLDSKPSICKAVMPSPASYQDATSCSQEEELSRLMAEISVLEGASTSSPEQRRHEAIMMMMGTPPKSKAEEPGGHT